jgi:hypothetical protein
MKIILESILINKLKLIKIYLKLSQILIDFIEMSLNISHRTHTQNAFQHNILHFNRSLILIIFHKILNDNKYIIQKVESLLIIVSELFLR